MSHGLPKVRIIGNGNTAKVLVNDVEIPCTFFIGLEKNPSELCTITVKMYAQDVDVEIYGPMVDLEVVKV